MKKLIYLLPVVLLVTSCQKDTGKGKDNFSPVEPTTSDLPTRVVSGINNMYKSISSGVGFELTLDAPTYTVDEYYTPIGGSKYTQMAIEAKDLTCKIAVELVPGATAADIKAHVGIHDLGGSITYKSNNTTRWSVSVNDADLDAYLVGTTLYADTTDEGLVNAADTILKLVFGQSAKSQVEEMIETFSGKFYLADMFNDEITEISSMIPRGEIADIPAEDQAEAVEELTELLAELNEDEDLKDIFKFYTDDKAGYKVTADVTAAKFADLVEASDGDYKGTLHALVESDGEGKITKVNAGTEMTVASEYKDAEFFPNYVGNAIYTDVSCNMSVNLALNYGISIVTPDFSSYEEFPMEAVQELMK